MAIAVEIRDTWSDGKRQFVVGSLTLTGGYPAGGDPISWKLPQIKSSKAPSFVIFNGTGGFLYRWGRSAGKFYMFLQDSSGEMAVHATANYSAAERADAIDFLAIFDQNR